MEYSPILQPVVALLIWTCVMWVWMYATRLPAIFKLPKEQADQAMTPGKLEEYLPSDVQRIAHNYNHLHEQPTLFYTVCIVLAITGLGEGLNLWLAWAYTIIRVVHSIFQSTVNTTPRFFIFVLASLCLFGLILHAAIAVFH